jgi:hypothetical protein
MYRQITVIAGKEDFTKWRTFCTFQFYLILAHLLQPYDTEDNLIPIMEYLASDGKSALYMCDENSEGNLK